MIVVIQCAATKRPGAGRLKTADGRDVIFVAHPEIAPIDGSFYARPDDEAGTGSSWRDLVLAYNRAPVGNPLRLSQAYRLYENRVYSRMVERLSVENIYILSAGWGLIRSDFLTPYYDITFSSSAHGSDAYKRRRKTDEFLDFCTLPENFDDEIVFFGGKDYVPLFSELTQRIKSKRTVFYNGRQFAPAPGCVFAKYETTTRTNWHYECASAFLRSLGDCQ
jgi:hypothetical protein